MGSADAAARPIRVFILDDHELVRRGLIDLLRTAPDIEVVGEAGNATDALHRIPAVTPDVALLDARLPDGNGIDVCREIRSTMPTCAVPDLDLVRRRRRPVLRCDGRCSRLPAQTGGRIGCDRRHPGRRPGKVADRSLADRKAAHAFAESPRPAREEEDPLSPREHEILELITEGCTNRQIGERLYLAEKTVKNYVSSLLTKLGMERRTQAAVYGAQHRLEKPTPP